jgi:hypothetical protein
VLEAPGLEEAEDDVQRLLHVAVAKPDRWNRCHTALYGLAGALPFVP